MPSTFTAGSLPTSGRYRDFWNPNKNWLDQAADRASGLSTVLTEEQLYALNDIINRGIFGGDAGISKIMSSNAPQNTLARERLKRTLMGKYRGRRGGALQAAFLNRVIAPQLESSFAERRNLMTQNAMSRLTGISQKTNILNNVLSQLGLAHQKSVNDRGPGFLDYAKAGIDLYKAV